MYKILGAAAAAMLTVTALAGCGDDGNSDGSGYCSDLGAAKESFAGLLNNQISQDTFVKFKDSLPGLQAEAPASIKGDWTTFNQAVQTFSVAMTKAGLTMDDMRGMGSGPMAGGVSMRTAMEAAAALGSAKVSTAQSAISANALKECNIDLTSP
jgi:hypothetical protein